MSDLWTSVPARVTRKMKALLRFLGLADAEVEKPLSYMPPLEATTIIGPGITMKGELKGDGTLMMLGHFEGEIAMSGAVHIGPDSRVDANITAASMVVAGAVRGNLSAEGRVEIVPTGSLTGNLRSGSFSAADGATVRGEIWVERSGATVAGTLQ